MTRRTISLLALLLVSSASAIPAAHATGTVRYSGTVAAIDPDSGVLIVEEVGPWRMERGATVTTRRTVHLTASTRYNLFMRVNAPGAFAGDFVEVAPDVNDAMPGDFVTAECVRESGRLVARAVTVAEMP